MSEHEPAAKAESTAVVKTVPESKNGKHHELRLGQIASTAIAGNDILSSALYVSGIAILFAGVYAPLIFLVIAGVLWLYKHVYTEVVEALPLNGGAYNCLLNATSKTVASVAGVMTILSYVATSVISAKTASAYLNSLFHFVPVLPITGLIILFFASLVILGVRDSARVAMGIFALHVVTLFIFVTLGILSMLNTGFGKFVPNFLTTIQLFQVQGGMPKMLFLAFATSLLGVSGFESSANFVEEQRRGVFRKTLRNMLIGVVIFNPLITLVVLHTLTIAQAVQAKDFILADVALVLGGPMFQYLMVFDAFLVLSGAVLTSFIGASGLMYRMTLDHCLPSSILIPHMKKRSTHVLRIVLAFTGLCLSILLLTRGNLLSLAGVYTISFLGVMTMFAVGNMVLRVTRPDLKRTYQGPLLYVILAAAATIAGIIGNILIDSRNVVYFAFYFLPAVSVVLLMVYRDYAIEGIMKLTNHWPKLHRKLYPLLEHVIKPRIILFAHAPDKLYKALEYIRRNETSRNIVIVYCEKDSDSLPARQKLERFQEYLCVFKEGKVFPRFAIELLIEKELEFGPEVVRRYANRFRISLNNVFVGSIHEFHEFTFDELGGVRIIQ